MIELGESQQKFYELMRENDPELAERYKQIELKIYHQNINNSAPKPNFICAYSRCKKPFHSYSQNRKYCSNKCSNLARTKFKGKAKKSFKNEKY